MRLFFSKHELKLRRKRTIAAVVCMVIVLGVYWILTRPQKAAPEMPTVIVEPVIKDDVEIFGEYVGRIRAQQFVEVRARVEGYLENMLFAEGTYVNKNQVLFVINQDLAQAELELGYTIVRSPLAGHISERNVDLGTLVGPGGKSLLATVVKSDTVLVDFSMTALDYLKSKERNINLGQQDSTRSWQPNITITLADNTVYPYKGYVDFAEPQVDPQTGTFSVRAEMPNPKQVLLPGQFTKVKLLLDVREGAIVVPMKAVTIEKGGAYIYTMRKDDTVEKRFIELGPEVGNNVVVERGLAVGETIVVEGFHKLTPGMKVRASRLDNAKGE